MAENENDEWTKRKRMKVSERDGQLKEGWMVESGMDK